MKPIIFILSLLLNLHTHDFPTYSTFGGVEKCWCGATRTVSFVYAPCPNSDPTGRTSCCVLHGGYQAGPIIEPNPWFHASINTGVYCDSYGWHVVVCGRKIL